MKKRGIEIKWGVIFVIAQLLWMFFEKAMGWHDEKISQHATYTNFFAIIAVSVYLLALYDKRRSFYHGIMSWKQGFIAGIFITLVVVILSPLVQYLIHQFVTPDYFENAIAFSVESNNATQEEAENYFNLSSYVLQATIGALVMGIITSALAALVMRRGSKLKTDLA